MHRYPAMAALLASVALAGCSGGGPGAEVTRSAPADAIAATAPRVPALAAATAQDAQSALIGGLLARRGVLSAGPLADVAGAVLAANSRAAEAGLRAAMLRSQARSRNWLPRLGPAVNLTSLGAVVTSLVLNQAILDHGARAAERDFARADVEVAAVALAEDANARVHQALGLYLAAQRATAQAEVLARAESEMGRYLWMIEERVRAGVSDRGELQAAGQRRDQIAADLAADREAAAVALSELQAMAATPVAGIAGLSPVGAPEAGVVALSVLRAQAEGSRAVAEATVTRAGYLPGLSLGGDLGGPGLGLTLGAQNGLGLGQGAAIEAALAEAAAVEANVAREDENARREIASLEGRLASFLRQEEEARRLAAQAQETLALMAAQQAAGQRGAQEVIGAIETRARAERTAAGLAHDIVAARIAIAARLGLLVDGERM
ncbi:MAG: TolC family protein [Rubellimicrobium sp.]|nr:TolC family protein [Rubellimicrobium sp.]